MTITKTLQEYKNGNYNVCLLEDGTKIRSWEDNIIPYPEFPESIDLKITNYCDAGCSYCHESSTTRGKHGDKNFITNILSTLPKGVEIAIGGGNPFSHPDLEEILNKIKSFGLISNITINSLHLGENTEKINYFWAQKLFYGLGISLNKKFGLCYEDYLKEEKINDIIDNENAIIHAIIGIEDPLKLIRNTDTLKKILVLGYKDFGFGKKYRNIEVNQCIEQWRYWIPTLLSKPNCIISFDNLALEQLNIKRIINKEIWDERYMGDDGKFSMYIDGVKQEYAISSTSSRKKCNDLTIKNMFENI